MNMTQWRRRLTRHTCVVRGLLLALLGLTLATDVMAVLAGSAASWWAWLAWVASLTLALLVIFAYLPVEYRRSKGAESKSGEPVAWQQRLAARPKLAGILVVISMGVMSALTLTFVSRAPPDEWAFTFVVSLVASTIGVFLAFRYLKVWRT
jgi:heme/copper-type cytochrome/quinol oxidase subunit 2